MRTLILTAVLSTAGEAADAIVALVASEPITDSEVKELLSRQGKTYTPQRWHSALEALIEHKILLRAAQEETIEVTEQELSSRLRSLRGGAPLKAEEEEKLREELREQMLVRRLLLRKVGYLAISPADIRAYYNERKEEFLEPESRHVRMIIVEDEKTAKEVLRELSAGRSFEELTRAHSVGPRRDAGGDWGWIKEGDLKEPIASAAFEMAVGERRGPIRFKEQYAILTLLGIRPCSPMPLSKVSREIKRILMRREFIKRRERCLEELKRWTDVVRFEERFPK